MKKINKMRRTALIATIMLLVLAMLSAGCGVKQNGNVIDGSGNNTGEHGNVVIEPGKLTGDDGKIIYGDGVIGEASDSESGKAEYEAISGWPKGGIKSDRTEAMPAYDMPAAVDGDWGGLEPIIPGPGVEDPGDYNGQIRAGTLTAGEIKDAKDFENWRSLWNDVEWDNLRKARGLYADNVISVSTLPMQYVRLFDGETLVFTAVSDIFGAATLVFPDSLKGKELTVQSIDATRTVTCTPGTTVSFTETMKFAPARPDMLDLMLMIDTTGSMGDELEYLKVEIKDVIERVKKEQKISVRLSVNFYRDEGDEYVVKYYDFRDDIDDCVKILGEQSANGGGDWPEAVHTALGNVLQHSWRENAVKLCFFVLDAPPHDESEIQGINAGMLKDLNAIAGNGIRIIPVVSSGADLSVEALMRSWAVMTGGTYLFLTNHSGIGGDHQTPTDTEYEIEPLNDCMVRVVKDYMFAPGTAQDDMQ
ncbi:MAG: VWA domain-containing protein [Clostridia bacterium]|nr:VWA domain-containing protein [Clostridia bacterium]